MTCAKERDGGQRYQAIPPRPSIRPPPPFSPSSYRPALIPWPCHRPLAPLPFRCPSETISESGTRGWHAAEQMPRGGHGQCSGPSLLLTSLGLPPWPRTWSWKPSSTPEQWQSVRRPRGSEGGTEKHGEGMNDPMRAAMSWAHSCPRPRGDSQPSGKKPKQQGRWRGTGQGRQAPPGMSTGMLLGGPLPTRKSRVRLAPFMASCGRRAGVSRAGSTEEARRGTGKENDDEGGNKRAQTRIGIELCRWTQTDRNR